MKRTPASYHRISRKVMPAVYRSVALLFFLGGIVAGFAYILREPDVREFMVVWGEPIHIVSADPKWQNVVIMAIDPDAVVPAAFGYGNYPVASLPELDEMDKRNGRLVTESLSQVFGLPITVYLRHSAAFADIRDPKSFLQSVFSWQTVWQRIQNTVDTNASWPAMLRWVIAASSVRSSAVSQVDIDGVYMPVQVPDGSRELALDMDKLDFYLESVFQDTLIRREAVSVGFYNTTDVGSMGQKAARAVSHLGANVVFIGNDDRPRDVCVVKSSRDLRHTKTYRFIRWYYRCREEEPVPDDRIVADISVYVGSRYAELFTKPE